MARIGMDVASMKGSITLHPVVVYLSHMVLYSSWVVGRDIAHTRREREQN